MIRALVVEDSPVVREFLVHILNSDPHLQVVATAQNGEEALEAVAVLLPLEEIEPVAGIEAEPAAVLVGFPEYPRAPRVVVA